MSDEQAMEDLRRRIQRLEDIEEIKNLRSRYHYYVNEMQVDRVHTLFTDDAIVHLGYLGRYQGREEIDRGYKAIGARERFGVKQFIHSHTVENLDGDRATGFSYLDAQYAYFGTSFIVAGRYDDVYVRRDGKWLFESMLVEFFYTVPAGVGWAGDELHWLSPENRPQSFRLSGGPRPEQGQG